jgi:hypothetical protein
MDASLFPVNTDIEKMGDISFMSIFTDAYNNLLNKKNEGKGEDSSEK